MDVGPVGDVTAEADLLLGELRQIASRSPVVDLEAIESAVVRFVARVEWPHTGLESAGPGQERLYRLGHESSDGPAAYLVSDGVGVVSPPHEHETWAVVAGIAGHEINHLFVRTSSEGRTVKKIETKVIGPGETLTMADDAIHATAVGDGSAIFHVHVYGRPLNSLSSFEDRCLIDVTASTLWIG